MVRPSVAKILDVLLPETFIFKPPSFHHLILVWINVLRQWSLTAKYHSYLKDKISNMANYSNYGFNNTPDKFLTCSVCYHVTMLPFYHVTMFFNPEFQRKSFTAQLPSPKFVPFTILCQAIENSMWVAFYCFWRIG